MDVFILTTIVLLYICLAFGAIYTVVFLAQRIDDWVMETYPNNRWRMAIVGIPGLVILSFLIALVIG